MTTNIRSMAAPPALTVAQIGNFHPPHSTENHVKQAFERNGHTVIPLQENTPEPWTEPVDADLVLWTRTGWDWSEACGWTARASVVETARVPRPHARPGDPDGRVSFGPLVGVGPGTPDLRRTVLPVRPHVHRRRWARRPMAVGWDQSRVDAPGVSLAECEREPIPRPEYARQPVVWVGSWQHYHPEWVGYRRQLIDTLRRHFRRRFGIYPRGGKAIRGQALRDLYAQALVIVGDSCLVGGATDVSLGPNSGESRAWGFPAPPVGRRRHGRGLHRRRTSRDLAVR